MNTSRNLSPWWWVPTLYFAEGIPYFIVNTISTILFKRMGMGNGDIAAWTSLLYLPWVIKPFWSPFVDILRTKRWWVVSMQLLLAACFAGLALTLPRPDPSVMEAGQTPVSLFGAMLAIFWISAFASATHDIAADGYYMLALDPHRQSLFVGIRSTFYRISSLFGQGVLVYVAGVLELRLGDIPAAWWWTLLLSAVILGLLGFFHLFALPRPAEDTPREAGSVAAVIRSFGETFSTFFRKPQIWVALVFLLLYRLPEAFLVKMINPFLLDGEAAGGLGLDTRTIGVLYGTVGMLGLTLGGILGGFFAARVGLKRALWPMVLAITVPDLVYLLLAWLQPHSLPLIGGCLFVEQFGYGFGFTAYLLYMIYISEGSFKTSHYSLCTAFMALSMMIPGFFAGWIQERLGYPQFFLLVMGCCLVTVAVTLLIKVDPSFGKKNTSAS